MDKYRAWDNCNKEMLKVDCINWYYKEIACYPKDRLSFSMDFKDLKLMRATGIKDKNNKDIYEGDILHWIDKNEKSDGSLEDTVIVYWSDDFLARVVVGTEWTEDTEIQYLFEYNNPGELEVIGNIYEGVL